MTARNEHRGRGAERERERKIERVTKPKQSILLHKIRLTVLEGSENSLIQNPKHRPREDG